MKETTPPGMYLLIGGLIVFIGMTFFGNNITSLIQGSPKGSGQHSSVKKYAVSPIVYRDEITCTYPQVVSATYDGSEISHELNKPETNPIVTTYAGLDQELAVARSIDATQTISEVDLVKIYEDQSQIVLIEGLNGVYTTVHTLYPDEGISFYSKQLSIFGLSFSASTALGTCK